MSELTLKEIVTSVSKVRQMEEAGLRTMSNFDLGFHLVKIYRLSKSIETSIKSIKTILLERKMDKTFFWEDDLKIWSGKKNSTSTIDVKKIYEFAVQNNLEKEFFAACSIVESKVDNILLKSALVLNKTVTTAEDFTEFKIDKITKEEHMLNV